MLNTKTESQNRLNRAKAAGAAKDSEKVCVRDAKWETSVSSNFPVVPDLKIPVWATGQGNCAPTPDVNRDQALWRRSASRPSNPAETSAKVPGSGTGLRVRVTVPISVYT